jgi:hypothetical protein
VVLAIDAGQVAPAEKDIADTEFPAYRRFLTPVKANGADVKPCIAAAPAGWTCKAVDTAIARANPALPQDFKVLKRIFLMFLHDIIDSVKLELIVRIDATNLWFGKCFIRSQIRIAVKSLNFLIRYKVIISMVIIWILCLLVIHLIVGIFGSMFSIIK